MPMLNKQTSRRVEADERKAMTPKKVAPQTGKKGDALQVPFRGSENAEHPHDPFRNIFGSSRLKFDF